MEDKRIKIFDRQIKQLIKEFGAPRVMENYEKKISSWVEELLPDGDYDTLTELIVICEKWARQKNPEINFTPDLVGHPYREVCSDLTAIVTALTPKLFAKILHEQRNKCAREDLFYELSDIFSQVGGDSVNYIVKRLENEKLRAANKLTFPGILPKKRQKMLETRLLHALEKNYQDEIVTQAYKARDSLIIDDLDQMLCEAHYAERGATGISALREVAVAHTKAQQQTNRARRAGRAER